VTACTDEVNATCDSPSTAVLLRLISSILCFCSNKVAGTNDKTTSAWWASAVFDGERFVYVDSSKIGSQIATCHAHSRPQTDTCHLLTSSGTLSERFAARNQRRFCGST